MRWRKLLIGACAVVVAACGRDRPDPTGTFDLTCNVPTGDLFFGGVSRDGIPALVFPEYVPGFDANFMDDDERVLGLAVDGVARAYPLAILWWHEVINDFLDKTPVLLTYCPLTGSGIAFEPRLDGELQVFGVSGILYENNLTMFDRFEETLWNQMLLGGVCGPGRGQQLTRMPVIESTWGYWRSLHPTTTIITPNTGWRRPYGIYPYGDYARLNNPATLFPTSEYSTERPPKELVLGVHQGAAAKAYPFGVLEEMGRTVALNETVGDRPLLITYRAFDFTAMAYNRVVDGETLTFAVADTVPVRYTDAETGSTWDRRGRAIDGPLAGAALTLYEDAYAVYWFAWSVYYPGTELFTGEPGAESREPDNADR